MRQKFIVEGMTCSACSSHVFNAVNKLNNKQPFILPKFSMIGALLNYITDDSVENFQPMGANFGIIPPLEIHIKDKKERYAALANRSLNYFKQIGEL